jgi:hypothetical protein
MQNIMLNAQAYRLSNLEVDIKLLAQRETVFLKYGAEGLSKFIAQGSSEL